MNATITDAYSNKEIAEREKQANDQLKYYAERQTEVKNHMEDLKRQPKPRNSDDDSQALLQKAKQEAELLNAQKLEKSLANRKDDAKLRQELYDTVIHKREYQMQSNRSNSDNIHAYIDDARRNHPNRGLTAIYRSDMSETTVIMLVESSPSETVNSSNATYPTPGLEPRINYSINSDKTTSASYVLYGDSYETMVHKYQQLLTWQQMGVELTLDGFSYLPNVYFTSVGRSMNTPRVKSMDLQISFLSAKHAIEKTTVTKKPPQPPKPPYKPSPGVYITVTRGMTYWWMWTKWGTAIQTLRNWNHYPDRFIPIGVRVRVK
ncbi:hypothetical protein IV37_GL000191 [Fructilactobacillus fructivorans]|uniref:hypothetical protein n=1 Tax=Fructilactobacillus fructivorans TaxID=1614 RepID=UPI000704B765|nr:hypothetical protein [Fructilactobacillus fructivorans]KRN13469.1 hypothetical protein IV37_GL000191 [Fructilactobacillus fructivorans]